ncbi:MAG: hypothetical protein P8Y92_14135 [Halioglobus sp.]|jgi:hypothetical protein
MKITRKLIGAAALLTIASVAQAQKDCLLEGTVQKSGSADGEQVAVKFHSMDKYDENANCRTRRGQKMEFKLPADPRLKEAPAGSEVRYRYRTDGKGNAEAELISIGT